MTNLVNASAITPILNSLIGKFDPPKNAQVGVIGKRTFESATEFDAMGYRRNDLPYYGSQTHMDGVATIYSRIPQDPKEVEGMTDDEKYNYYIQNDSPKAVFLGDHNVITNHLCRGLLYQQSKPIPAFPVDSLWKK